MTPQGLKLCPNRKKIHGKIFKFYSYKYNQVQAALIRIIQNKRIQETQINKAKVCLQSYRCFFLALKALK